MTLSRPAAILVILAAAAAGPAQATTIQVIDPLAFGGFDNVGESPGAWTASGGLAAPADFAIASDRNNFNGTSEGVVTAANAGTWEYIGLQNLSVADGSTVTVSAEIWPNTVQDQIRLGYGPTGGAITLPAGMIQGFAMAVYTPVTFSFTAPGSSIDINFGFLNAEGTSLPIQIDAVSVSYDTIDTPEPASMALLGAALLGLGLVRRRQRA